METISALLALCAGNSPATGEFPAQRPMTRSFDVSSYLSLNKRLSKESWGWCFETPWCLLWRYCNDIRHVLPLTSCIYVHIYIYIYIYIYTNVWLFCFVVIQLCFTIHCKIFLWVTKPEYVPKAVLCAQRVLKNHGTRIDYSRQVNLGHSWKLMCRV